MEDAKSSANRCLVVVERIICKAKPRIEVPQGRVVFKDIEPAKTFVIRKKERFIFPYRTAEARAELILAERRQLRTVEGTPRVERAVAEVLEDRTMKLIGSGPRHSIDRGACAAKLCTVGIRLG